MTVKFLFWKKLFMVSRVITFFFLKEYLIFILKSQNYDVLFFSYIFFQIAQTKLLEKKNHNQKKNVDEKTPCRKK